MKRGAISLEGQLGNALGLALVFLRTGDWNNRDIARLEAPFKAWCDKVVDGSPDPSPTDEELMEVFWEHQNGMEELWASDWPAAARAVLARWGSNKEAL